MATKLYPPNINGTIPAFVGTTLVVPFSLNRAVSKSEIAGFVVKIKTVQGSVLLGTVRQLDSNYFDLNNDLFVSFDVSSIHFNVGQYYKVQMAFIDTNGIIGYYSTVGVVKFTTAPYVTIMGLTISENNNHIYTYTGLYNQESGDISEKLYSSSFKLYNSAYELIESSGEILHNNSNDIESYEAYENFTFSSEIPDSEIYFVQYSITTTNGYSASSSMFPLYKEEIVNPDLNAKLEAELVFDEGCIDLFLVNIPKNNNEAEYCSGNFIISRSASDEKNTWHKIYEFTLQSEIPSKFLWRDYSIKQGVTYTYAIQQYNDYNLYSKKLTSNEIKADFEDAFLYDGEKQLKIRFNPKISSFKTDILESKLETIGNQYPFFFRNGSIHYKEFPISGLISYKMDENKNFIKWEEPEENYDGYMSTSYELEYTLLERNFKLEVLNWLNNGEVKLFKSPTEGNYLVRLMNVSLTPQDTLGRLLHNFTSTAYEVAEYNYNTLKNYGFVNQKIAQEKSKRQWCTVELAGHDERLDSILENLRRYLEAGISVSFTEEQYNRVLSSNYSLKSLFTVSEKIGYYKLVNVTDKILSTFGAILGKNIEENTTFSSSEYEKIILRSNDYKVYFLPQEVSAIYNIVPSETVTDEAIEALEKIKGTVTYATGKINTRIAYSIFAVDMLPGTILNLTFQETGSKKTTTEEIIIGSTGSYKADFSLPVISIEIPKKIVNNSIYTNGIQGSITYSYNTKVDSFFNTIREVKNGQMPLRQWVGSQEKTYYDKSIKDFVTTNNLIEIIQDEKTTISNIFYMHFSKRENKNIYTKALYLENQDKIYLDNLPEGIRFVPYGDEIAKKECYDKNNSYSLAYETEMVIDVSTGKSNTIYHYYYYKNNNTDKSNSYVPVYTYYSDKDCKYEIDLSNLEPYCVYQICNGRFDYTYQTVLNEEDFVDSNFLHGYYVDSKGEEWPVSSGYLLDGLSTKDNLIFYMEKDFSNKITINEDEIDLTEKEEISFKNFNSNLINSIVIGEGVICELSYQYNTKIYDLEYTNLSVNSRKVLYESSIKQLEAHYKMLSLDYEKQLALRNLNPNSVNYKTIEANYNTQKNNYIAILGGSTKYSPQDYTSISNFSNKKQLLIDQIKDNYSVFIYQLSLALEAYMEVNSVT